MSIRSTSRIGVAAALLLGAVAWWRMSRIPPAPAPVAAVAAPPRLPERPPDIPPARPDPGAAAEDVRTSVRDSLQRKPGDLTPLARLEALPAGAAADALLEFAGPAWPSDTRAEALKRLGERELGEAQLRVVARLFEGEPDEDLRSCLLLGILKSTHPAAGDLARKAVLDPEETVRSVALTALHPAQEADRRVLIGLAASDSSGRIRGSAALRLNEQSADPEVRAALLAVALRDASEENRKLAISSLKREALRGEPEVLESLRWSASEDPSAGVQSHARALLDGLKAGK